MIMNHFLVLILSLSLLNFACSEDKKNNEQEKIKANQGETTDLTPCKCAKMDPSDLPEECLELKKQWEKEFSMADESKKEEMTKEIIDCMNN